MIGAPVGVLVTSAGGGAGVGAGGAGSRRQAMARRSRSVERTPATIAARVPVEVPQTCARSRKVCTSGLGERRKLRATFRRVDGHGERTTLDE
jgi:hypothetical protein